MIEALLIKNLSWINGIARTFCRNRMDAEDLVGDTILKVLLNADRYDIGKPFRIWVLVIMRNTFHNRLRRIGIVESFADLPECPCDEDPTRHYTLNENVATIEAYAKTSVCVRCALLFAQGYSYGEIAGIQDVTPNIVKCRVHHVRRLIIKVLKP
jgi:RNA polymerase sigma-70 factor (ECF subfamily)